MDSSPDFGDDFFNPSFYSVVVLYITVAVKEFVMAGNVDWDGFQKSSQNLVPALPKAEDAQPLLPAEVLPDESSVPKYVNAIFSVQVGFGKLCFSSLDSGNGVSRILEGFFFVCETTNLEGGDDVGQSCGVEFSQETFPSVSVLANAVIAFLEEKSLASKGGLGSQNVVNAIACFERPGDPDFFGAHVPLAMVIQPLSNRDFSDLQVLLFAHFSTIEH